jgi:hypothetical protein
MVGSLVLSFVLAGAALAREAAEAPSGEDSASDACVLAGGDAAVCDQLEVLLSACGGAAAGDDDASGAEPGDDNGGAVEPGDDGGGEVAEQSQGRGSGEAEPVEVSGVDDTADSADTGAEDSGDESEAGDDSGGDDSGEDDAGFDDGAYAGAACEDVCLDAPSWAEACHASLGDVGACADLDAAIAAACGQEASAGAPRALSCDGTGGGGRGLLAVAAMVLGLRRGRWIRRA